MTTQTTAHAGHWLQTIPPADAAALVAAIEAAHAALPQLRPGCRAILTGMLWRVEVAGWRATFADLDGAPLIVDGGLAEFPQSGRSRRKVVFL